jgi:2-polyprenyl-3-methyl-5-hydroxy-6-metoxy-1,4-benzoquinol methylase
MSTFFEPTYQKLLERPNGEDWWHNMPLPDRNRIAGAHGDRNFQLKLWQNLNIDPGILVKRRVLDVGARDGFFTVAALLAGADEVTAINTARPTYPKNLAFAAGQWCVSPDIVVDDFQSHTFIGTYDVVLFLGMLYHLENMFLAMRRLRELLKESGLVYIETQMSQVESPLPLFESASDIYPTIARQNKGKRGSNFLLPNEAAIRNLAHSYDFACERLQGIYTRQYPSRGVFKLTKFSLSA